MAKKWTKKDYAKWEKVYQFLKLKFGDRFGGYLDVGAFKDVEVKAAPGGQVSVELKVSLDTFDAVIAAIEKVEV